MNLSLYSVQAFVVLDTEGNRVLAKYYRPKSHPQGESKELLTLKEQKVFEKGLWQKTKKAGGAYMIISNTNLIDVVIQAISFFMIPISWYISTLWTSFSTLSLARRRMKSCSSLRLHR